MHRPCQGSTNLRSTPWWASTNLQRLVKPKVCPWWASTNLQRLVKPKVCPLWASMNLQRIIKPKVHLWWASTNLQRLIKPKVRPWWASTTLQGSSNPRFSLCEPWQIFKARQTQGLPLVSLSETPKARQTQGSSLVSLLSLVNSSSKSLWSWVKSFTMQKRSIARLIGKTFNKVKIKVSSYSHKWKALQSKKDTSPSWLTRPLTRFRSNPRWSNIISFSISYKPVMKGEIATNKEPFSSLYDEYQWSNMQVNPQYNKLWQW